MKCRFLFLLCSPFLFGCASTPPRGTHANEGHGYTIEHTEKNTKNYGSVSIEYESREVLMQEKLRELDNRLADEATRADELAAIPAGGYIFLHIRRITIASANTDMFQYVVTDGDKVLYRADGEWRLPSTPVSRFDTWKNIEVLRLKQPIQTGISVYVIDKLGGRDCFVISKPTAGAQSAR